MFYGYAIDRRAHKIYLFRSEYRTREATRDNVERCVTEQTGTGAWIMSWDIVIHTERAADGMDERVEFLATDMVTCCGGVDPGYAIERGIVVKPRPTAAELAEAEESEREAREYAEECELAKLAEMSAEDRFFALASIGDACEGTATKFKATSLNLWFEGETAHLADQLKALGCRWSEKRKGYYWRIPQAA